MLEVDQKWCLASSLDGTNTTTENGTSEEGVEEITA